jgi:NADPH:quinone reductase-like Zn-dependent oxidoreductase
MRMSEIDWLTVAYSCALSARLVWMRLHQGYAALPFTSIHEIRQYLRKISLVLDTVGGTPVGELARSLEAGGSIVVYGIQSGQFPALSPGDFVFRGLGLHGFWLLNWIRDAPRTEIQETYQKLGGLVADGSLSAAVEHVYPLEQFKEAFKRSLKLNRSGKILFKFGAH